MLPAVLREVRESDAWLLFVWGIDAGQALGELPYCQKPVKALAHIAIVALLLTAVSFIVFCFLFTAEGHIGPDIAIYFTVKIGGFRKNTALQNKFHI